MKKTLIASAVAAAALTTNAFAMDQATDLSERLDSMPTVYGNIQLAHFWNEAEDASGNTIAADSGHEFADGGSTIGFKHSHQISEGLTGFLKAELEFDADDKAGTLDVKDAAGNKTGTVKAPGATQLDEAYIGVKGDFGSVQVGSDDTVYEQMINITDTSEQIGLGGYLAANGEGDNVQYVGSFDAITVGLTHPIDDTSDTASTQLAAKFSADMFSVALAYAMSRDAGATKGQDAIGFAADANIDDLTLQLQYETQDESASGANDGGDYLAVQGLYSMGANTFALGYGISGTDATGAEDETTIYAQALHSLSDNMYVYLEVAMTDDYGNVADQENTATAVGATYSF